VLGVVNLKVPEKPSPVLVLYLGTRDMNIVTDYLKKSNSSTFFPLY